ncbi:molybdenum cofactor guanylyltransferase MobA [Bordetella genomosp. 9]|uniref:molybdenum cofactor guanylyltransferase MobA n=1 Tax=Bordetella genomosp. 9 TaxID=1416803 RepID=UPI003B27C19E
MKAAEIGGLILAGGRGARMGDVDKGLVPLDGRPLVAHVRARLAPQVGAIWVSANRNADRYAEYGRVVADMPAHAGWQGPLAGVAAGLSAATLPWIATVPCDTPFLPPDLVSRLAQGLARSWENARGDTHSDADPDTAPRIAVASAGGRRQAVCMLLPRALLPDLLHFLASGGRKVEAWQTRAGCVEVPFDDAPGAFMNVNTPGDLIAARGQDNQCWKS